MQDEEALRADCDAYDCATCPVDESFVGLEEDRDNWDAWQLFHRVFTRCAVDTHVSNVLLERVLRDLETGDAFDLMERFTVLYDVLQPPPEKH